MTAPKLTEAEREDVDALTRIETGTGPRVDAFVLVTLKNLGLIEWSADRPRDPGQWQLTDAGRAALKGGRMKTLQELEADPQTEPTK